MVFSYLEYLRNNQKFDNSINLLKANLAKDNSLINVSNNLGNFGTTKDLIFNNQVMAKKINDQLELEKKIDQQNYSNDLKNNTKVKNNLYDLFAKSNNMFSFFSKGLLF
ncbi:hypothetical protein ACFX5K_02775 [Rickettsiales bacterium LUAb2]